jgi:hypothetical protein
LRFAAAFFVFVHVVVVLVVVVVVVIAAAAFVVSLFGMIGFVFMLMLPPQMLENKAWVLAAESQILKRSEERTPYLDFHPNKRTPPPFLSLFRH